MMEPGQFRKGICEIKVGSFSFDENSPNFRHPAFGSTRVSLNSSVPKKRARVFDDLNGQLVDVIVSDKLSSSIGLSSGDSSKFKNIGVFSKTYFDDSSVFHSGYNFSYKLIENPEIFPKPAAPGQATIFNDDLLELSNGEIEFLQSGGVPLNLEGLKSLSAARRIRHNGGSGSLFYSFLVGESDSSSRPTVYGADSQNINSRVNLDFYPLSLEDYPVFQKFSNESAHLTYDVREGTNSKNCFSVGFEAVDSIKLEGYFLEESESLVNLDDIFYQPYMGVDPIIYHGAWNYTTKYQRLCSVKGGGCGGADDIPGFEIECWTGNNITGADYIGWVFEILTKWRSDRFDTSFRKESDTSFSMSGVEVLFSSWTGYVIFNDFASGDKVEFKPYNFRSSDYYETYTSYFLSPPKFDEPQSFSIEYLKDFSSPSELVESLNSGFIQTGSSKSVSQSSFYPDVRFAPPSFKLLFGGGGLFHDGGNLSFSQYSNLYFDDNIILYEGQNLHTGGLLTSPPSKQLFGGFTLSTCIVNGGSISKIPEITYGEMQSPFSGSGFRSNGAFSSNGKWTEDSLFAPGSNFASAISWVNPSSEGSFFRLNGSISDASDKGFQNVSFKIIKNSQTQLYPIDGGWANVSNWQRGVSFDSLDISSFLNFGETIDLVFSAGNPNPISGLWLRPSVQRVEDSESKRRNRISLTREFRNKTSTFFNDFSGFYESGDSSLGFFENKMAKNDSYPVLGTYVGDSSSFMGLFENMSFVDFDSDHSRGGQVWNSNFSGQISYELRVDRGMSIFSSPFFNSHSKHCNLSSDFDYFVRQNSTLLKSGTFIDGFSDTGVFWTDDKVYSGGYLHGQIDVNYGDKLFFGFGKRTNFTIDVNFDARINLMSGTISGVANPIWYPYECPAGFGEQGIYFSTAEFPLAQAEICNECIDSLFGQTGGPANSEIFEALSGRVIKITSNHFNSGGYNLVYDKNEAARAVVEEIRKDQIKFLLPSGVEFLGSNDGSNWTYLGGVNNIDWLGLRPQVVKITGEIEETGKANFNFPELIPFEDPSFPEDFSFSSQFPLGEYQTLFSLQQVKFQPGSQAFCPPTPKEKNGRAVWPINWPATYYGFDEMGRFLHPCRIEELEYKEVNCPQNCDRCGCTDPNATNYDPLADCPCLDELGNINGCCKNESRLSAPKKAPVHDLYFLRTGFILDYAKDGSEPNPESIEFNYYKLNFKDGFSASPNDMDKSITVDNFYFKNVNLFSAVPAPASALTGESICVIGSDYTVDVFGNVPVRVTGIFEQEFNIENKGIVDYENVLMEGLISGLNSGDWVLFNKESGKLTSDSGSGFFSGKIFATGLFSSGVEGQFYNPITRQVTFTKEVKVGILNSGHISEEDAGLLGLDSIFWNTPDPSGSGGFGYYSGNFDTIKDRVVNSAIAVGGFLNPEVDVIASGNLYITGLILGKKYVENVSGFFDLEVELSGQTSQGFYSEYFETGGNVPSLVNYLYDPIEANKASGRLQIVGALRNFDLISIGDSDIRFSTDDPDVFSAPDYFSGFANLIEIISGNSDIFQVSIANVDYINSGFTLISNLPGESGNLQEFFTNNSSRISLTPNLGFFSGGEFTYQQLEGFLPYPINTPIQYSIAKDLYLFATGYYTSTSGSGNLFGDIESFFGIRNFNNVWNIFTGDSFASMNYFDSINSFSGDFYSESGDILPSNLRTRILYNNVFNSQVPDVLRMTAYDNNFGSGIVIDFSGVKR